MRGLPDVASDILMTHQERNAQDQHMLGEVDAFIISKRANSSIFCKEKPYSHYKLNYWVAKIRKKQKNSTGWFPKRILCIKDGWRREPNGRECLYFNFRNSPISLGVLNIRLTPYSQV
jgi:hypothetical protein